MDYVFTSRALEACLANAPSRDWFSTLEIPGQGAWQVASVSTHLAVFVFHREDSIDEARIVILDNGKGPFGDLPEDARAVAAQRVHRATIEAQRPPMRLPRDWREFHDRNLVAFFATNDASGSLAGSPRWVMSVDHTSVWTICFWRVTKDVAKLRLEDFVPDTARVSNLLSDWPSSFEDAQKFLSSIPEPPVTEALETAVDLEILTNAAVTGYRTYRTWLPLLTPEQQRFLELPTDHSAKLRGPAGSGKTLTLELKLLRELYRARDAQKSLRILYATHSWAMAAQVDASLRILDETGNLDGVDVLPLVAVAQAGLPKERSGPGAGAGFQLLGEDSLSGKQHQLETIASTVSRIRHGDWLAYRNRVTADFRARVESMEGSGEYAAFIWDLMNEFASVLSANGILPGVNAERRYLAIPRGLWMMPLVTDTEKRFVLRVYADYVASLKKDSLLTTDQLVNDFHNYLETFVWNLRRGQEGYDLIFVDELHLFGEQERLVLHYLTRSPDEYPTIFMALDPRQSPNEVYATVSSAAIQSRSSGEADRALGKVDAVDLASVHRFSKNVLQLVRHINRSFPALELGPDWVLDLEHVQSTNPHESVPTLTRYSTLEAEMSGVLTAAAQSVAEGRPERRVAIILLDPLLIDDFAEVASHANLSISVIRGRDDIEQLRYAKRSVVLSASEYVGGLQFNVVHCAGFVAAGGGRANAGYQMRRFLALLYLAVSRASEEVHLHVNDSCGGVPNVLESALRSGTLAENLPHTNAGNS